MSKPLEITIQGFQDFGISLQECAKAFEAMAAAFKGPVLAPGVLMPSFVGFDLATPAEARNQDFRVRINGPSGRLRCDGV